MLSFDPIAGYLTIPQAEAASDAYARLKASGARPRLVPINTHVQRGPFRKCRVLDCPAATFLLGGTWCADHTFTRPSGARWPATRSEDQ